MAIKKAWLHHPINKDGASRRLYLLGSFIRTNGIRAKVFNRLCLLDARQTSSRNWSLEYREVCPRE